VNGTVVVVVGPPAADFEDEFEDDHDVTPSWATTSIVTRIPYARTRMVWSLGGA
jgi:hypothetical protein